MAFDGSACRTGCILTSSEAGAIYALFPFGRSNDCGTGIIRKTRFVKTGRTGGLPRRASLRLRRAVSGVAQAARAAVPRRRSLPRCLHRLPLRALQALVVFILLGVSLEMRLARKATNAATVIGAASGAVGLAHAPTAGAAMAVSVCPCRSWLLGLGAFGPVR